MALVYGPEGFDYLELITIPELIEIRKIWVAENHEFDDSLPVIYERVMGKPFPDKSVYTSTSFKEQCFIIIGLRFTYTP